MYFMYPLMYPLLSLIRAQRNFTCGVIELHFFKFLVVIAKNAVIKIGDKKNVADGARLRVMTRQRCAKNPCNGTH